MFSQMVIVVLGFLLMFTGISDQNLLQSLVGVYVTLNSVYTIYKLEEGSALTSSGFRNNVRP